MKGTLEIGFRGRKCWGGQWDLFACLYSCFHCMAQKCWFLFLLPRTNRTNGLYIITPANASFFFRHILLVCLPFWSSLLLTDFVRNRSPWFSFPLSHIFYSTVSGIYHGLRKAAHCWTESCQSGAKLSSRHGSPNLRSIEIQNIKTMHV